MRFVSGLTLFFYTIMFLLIGALFIVIALNIIPQESIIEVLDAAYSSTNTRLALGITGILLIFISMMAAQIAMGKIQREKTIAFENPDGQVTISLSAIEDFIKRSLKQMPEVKELKPNVRAGKKGIAIINRVTLFSDVNIPETTEKIQNIVKSSVRDMLGVEELISVRVHVVKIAYKEETAKDVKKEDKPPQFRGSIEYGSF